MLNAADPGVCPVALPVWLFVCMGAVWTSDGQCWALYLIDTRGVVFFTHIMIQCTRFESILTSHLSNYVLIFVFLLLQCSFVCVEDPFFQTLDSNSLNSSSFLSAHVVSVVLNLNQGDRKDVWSLNHSVQGLNDFKCSEMNPKSFNGHFS